MYTKAILSLALWVSASTATFCSNCPPNPTITATAVLISTSTVTQYTGTASTSVVFLPGNPPAAKRDIVDEQLDHLLDRRTQCNADDCLRALRGNSASAATFCATYTSSATTQCASIPTYVPSKCDASRLSSACSCLSTAAPTTTTTTTTKATTTCTCPALTTNTVTATLATATKITTTLPQPASTVTKYPCADPLPTLTPKLPYGDASSPSDLGTSNSLFYSTTPEGSSASACCNACFFGITNCIQAFYYFYEGCVVSQATNLASGTGQGISAACPVGKFAGLTYAPDTSPAFRSTGNFAGPCGQTYNDL